MIYTLCIIAALVLVFSINGLLQPKHFRVSRSITIKGTPETIFPLIEDLKNWDAWSPWAEKDPGMIKEFSDPSHGIGASYMWHGNKQVGKGKMTITATVAHESVSIDLDIDTPVEAHNKVRFSLQAQTNNQNNNTTATWQMSGPQNFVMRAMNFFFDMDKMVGKDFETGLRSLKALVED